ncbi:Uncharacterised protein [uncultured Roseburia sp.]|uniref:Ryanodine receptor Ryr domain-containing protein n=1 Tax=Brotonthovivens ammoniilytica TaxID=2981725 RepID=A0ABT2TM97_9FIRM|nr:hypothetical protein [Brotonthovivens ammoniilytica]MCU6763338.1 hypothetical protein [Brotonthovivens ammoniilytica]SCJ14047.1 Uncharacterised protein [uncultured Roseburia sp.]
MEDLKCDAMTEKRKRRLRQTVKFGIIASPFVIGGIGFSLLYGGSVISGFYDALCLYGLQLNVDKEDVNLLINIARWAAPCMTVAVLFTVLSAVFKNMQVRRKVRKKDAAAIHGDSRYIPVVGQKIGKHAVVSESPLSFRAPRQILIFDTDYEMFQYLHVHEKDLFGNPDKILYLCTERIARGSYKEQGLQICNLAENCGRAYWKENLLQKDEKIIVIIGFGNYGQEILNQGLLMNVRDITSDLQYHIFGNSKEYQHLHHKLSRFVNVGNDKENRVEGRDSVIFHEELWYEDEALIQAADRIILAYDEEERNLLILNELHKYFIMNKIYIKVFNEQILKTLWDIEKMQIVPYGTDEQMCEPEMILGESTLIRAKMCHATYIRNAPAEYGGCREKEAGSCQKTLNACISCPHFLQDWNSMNYFTKYSNVAQADHMCVKEQILMEGYTYPKGVKKGDFLKEIYRNLSDEEKNKMREIEHLRWMRYHYLQNWDYAPKRDKQKHFHNLLVDFSDLALEEQMKDDDTYNTMFEIYNEG